MLFTRAMVIVTEPTNSISNIIRGIMREKHHTFNNLGMTYFENTRPLVLFKVYARIIISLRSHIKTMKFL